VQNAAIEVRHPSHGATTIFGDPRAETHGLVWQPTRATTTDGRLSALYRRKKERHEAAWNSYCRQRDELQQLHIERVHSVSCESRDAFQQAAAKISNTMATLAEDKIMALDETSLQDVRTCTMPCCLSVRSLLTSDLNLMDLFEIKLFHDFTLYHAVVSCLACLL
jgi:hypothetical protein